MGQKRWEVIGLSADTGYERPGYVAHSVRLDGKELHILPHLERAQAEAIERMLNLIVASHATIS